MRARMGHDAHEGSAGIRMLCSERRIDCGEAFQRDWLRRGPSSRLRDSSAEDAVGWSTRGGGGGR